MKRALLILLVASAAFAQEDKEKKPEPPKDNISTTQHTVRVEGQAIAYTAKAGTIVVKDEEGVARASMFFVSYTKDGADPATRPIMYTFNGGPGSS
jgi:carboxypeptidase C (cathepsin A)